MAISAEQKNAIALRVSLDPDTSMLMSVTDVMVKVGKSRQSWYDWMDQEEFRAAYKKALDCHVEIENAEVVRQLAKRGFNEDQRLRLYMADKPQRTESEHKHSGTISIVVGTTAEGV